MNSQAKMRCEVCNKALYNTESEEPAYVVSLVNMIEDLDYERVEDLAMFCSEHLPKF